MALTKITLNALADSSVDTDAVGANTITTTKIADTNVTHAKLHTDMDLSSKTVTLPTLSALNTTGNVGIGTSSPGVKLHVDGAGSQPELRVSQNSTYFTDYGVNHIDVNGPNDLRFLMGGSEKVRIKSGGDMSIGSDHSGFSGWRVLNMRQLSTGALINFEDDDGTRASTLAAWGSALRYQTHIAGGYHKFETDASTNAFQINDNGHVVVNTHQFPSNPTGSKLNVFGDGEVLRLDGTGNTSRTLRFRGVTTSNPAIIMADGSLEITNEDANTSIALLSERDITIKTTKSNGTAGHVKFYSYNTEIMRVDGANNRVGIGTASPTYKLHVNSGATNVVADFESTDGTAGIRLRDNAGNVELSTAGGDFRVQPSGSAVAFSVSTDGRLSQKYYAISHTYNGSSFVEIRGGKRTGTGTYSLFQNNSPSSQSSGLVHVQAIYATPSGSGAWLYKIQGNRQIHSIWSQTSGYSGSTPSVYWSGDTLYVDNTNSSVYYSVIIELHDIGNSWVPVWGNLPGLI